MARMSPARARGTRLPQLVQAVIDYARCARLGGPSPDDWFRRDEDSQSEWVLRRHTLISYCHGCPVMTACREIGLRLDGMYGDGDMVRGGVTGADLHAARHDPRQRISIARARLADLKFAGPVDDADRTRLHVEIAAAQAEIDAADSTDSGTELSEAA